MDRRFGFQYYHRMSLLGTIQQLADFDTALLANTIGYVDATPPEEWYMGGSIQSVTPTLGPTVGVAVTCELDSSTPGNQVDMEPFLQQLEKIHAMEEPVVWVAKAIGSRPDHECIMGDGMAKLLYAAGSVGAVTNGGVRDVDGLLSVPYPVYSKGTVIHHTPIRFCKINQPVEIGGITVSPGDVIHANKEGVIKIPPGCLDVLTERAIAMRAVEHESHIGNRRSDLEPREAKRRTAAKVKEYGF